MDPLLSADEQFLAKPAHLERHVPPRLRRALLPECAPVLAGATPVSEARSQDGTVKLLLELSDGLKVECVVIPISGKHTSLCVSSQVGCSRGCTFCSTGTMGLVMLKMGIVVLTTGIMMLEICIVMGIMMPKISIMMPKI